MELRECPFCGGEGVYEGCYDDYNHDCIVCHNNECGAVLTCYPYEGENIVNAWNTRAADAEIARLTAELERLLKITSAETCGHDSLMTLSEMCSTDGWQ